MLQASKAPPCRFFFYIIVVLRIIVEAVETIRRFRRRGKALVSIPFVQATNMHNEYGLVAVERRMPFRSPSQDVGLACLRCNKDYRFMARGVPMDFCGDAIQLAASSAASNDPTQLAVEPVKLKCDQHELQTALRNLNLHRQISDICRQMARATVAMYAA